MVVMTVEPERGPEQAKVVSANIRRSIKKEDTLEISNGK